MRGRYALWLIPPGLAGALLRLWNLRSQILLDDELHALRAALAWDLPKILTTYHTADICMPLAALYRGLAEAGVPLTEGLLRAPSLAAGLALPVALPLAFRRLAGERGAVFLAWLLALSPALVYYGRIARPYGLVALLAPLAAACFWRWWRGGAHGWGGGYALAGAASGWLHLGALPFVAAPLGFAGLAVAYRRLRCGARPPGGDRDLRQVLALALLLALPVAAFLVPARASLWRLLRTKLGGGADLESVAGTLLVQGGSALAPVAALFWVAALGGLVVLARRRSEAALFTVTLGAVQWVAVTAVFRPFAIGHPIVLGRYLLVTLPIVLLWTALGLDALVAPLRSRLGRAAAGAASAGLLLALAAAAPYRSDPRLRLGPFAASTEAIDLLPPPLRLAPREVPSVYRLVAGEPRPGSVVHAPVAANSRATAGIRALSQLHERDVLLGVIEERLDDPRVALRTLVPAEPEVLLASGARFLILDREPGRLSLLARRSADPRRRRGAAGPKVLEAAAALESRLRKSWGEPDLVDGSLRFWDLERVRLAAP